MPIKKIRDLQEMEDSLWYEPETRSSGGRSRPSGSSRNRRAHSAFPPGVYKHRTIEDAQRQRDLWEEQNFKAFWERRGSPRRAWATAKRNGTKMNHRCLLISKQQSIRDVLTL